MIIIDPVTLGDASCTRASPKWVHSRAGTLVQVPVDTLAVTYDPADLSKAPYALIEPGATNRLLHSEQLDNAAWSKSAVTVTANAATAPDGSMTADKLTATSADSYCLQLIAGATGQHVFSVWLRADADTALSFYIADNGGGGAATGQSVNVTTQWKRYSVARTVAPGATGFYVQIGGGSSFSTNKAVYAWGAQAESGGKVTSYIQTTGTTVARAADVINSVAGLLHSSVAPTEPLWTPGTYAQGVLVRDASHTVYESLTSNNTAQLSDGTKWGVAGVTAPRAMFDQYNNTQTTAADEILVALSPQAISQGLYLGNVDATEIRVSVVDPVEGVVFSEVASLISPSQGSSFYNLAFQRIKRSNYFFTTKLPPYSGALVTVSIRKIGSIAKCGMCAIGPSDDFGPSLYGLATEGKDYSSTTFDSDGTSSTRIRPYAKRMSVDVSVENSDLDYLHTRLEELRQRPIVWIGGPYGSTAVFGRYGSFRNVIDHYTRSKMALTIEGTV
jgi:hypothetical protein